MAHPSNHGHDRRGRSDTDQRYVYIALALTSGLLVGEVIGAIFAHSLALLSDAAHLLTDVGALALAAWAIRLAKRPAQTRWTYGFERVEILSAAASGVALGIISILIAAVAIRRLVAPNPVHGLTVIVVAGVGALVNVASAWALSRADRRSLNLRGAYLHVVTDLYAFIGTAAAGLLIVLEGWYRADAVASLVVVVLTAHASWGLLRDSGRVLLQGTPESLDLDDVRAHLGALSHVIDVHDLHAWTVTSGSLTISAHVVVENHCFESGHAPQVLDTLQQCLRDDFGVAHATFQLEPASHVDHEGDIHH